MKFTPSAKEKLSLCLWAILVLTSVSLFFRFTDNIPPTHSGQSSESAKDVFATDDSSEANLPQDASPVVSADLSGKSFINETKYSISETTLETLTKGNPNDAILIIHTYGTQGYCKEGYVTFRSTLKSEDSEENVICAGEVIKELLTEKGITVFHDKTLYDKISYSNAYTLATDAVKKQLTDNPNIKYVIDIQRDSLFTQDGRCIKAVTTTERGKTAQINFISGSDQNGADYPNWKDNLSLTYEVSENLYKTNQKLSRGVTLKPSGYGQYSSENFITVEIGTAGNTPDEAKNAAAFLAEALYDTIFD